MKKHELINKYNLEIKKIEKQKLEEYGKDIKPLIFMNRLESNRLCYLNGKLETYKRILNDLK